MQVFGKGLEFFAKADDVFVTFAPVLKKREFVEELLLGFGEVMVLPVAAEFLDRMNRIRQNYFYRSMVAAFWTASASWVTSSAVL